MEFVEQLFNLVYFGRQPKYIKLHMIQNLPLIEIM